MRIRVALLLVAVLSGVAACSSKSAVSTSTTSTSGRPSTSGQASTSTCGTTTTAPQDNNGNEVSPPGDIPDNQAFVAYSPPSGSYTVKVPEGWARTESADAVTFSDKFNSIRVEVVQTVPAPTGTCVDMVKTSTVTRKGGQALLTTYQADSRPDPVTGKVVRQDVERYAFTRPGSSDTAVLTLAGAAGSDNVDPWKIVTDSFAWR
ncbi:MAG TPA: hypothetical protein VGO92_01840 [Acidimicrobiales bacterium]|jgi:hypothetical protein|nr:hypothetical protein [Acidimicrobiales bacterium]